MEGILKVENENGLEIEAILNQGIYKLVDIEEKKNTKIQQLHSTSTYNKNKVEN